jgi:hypothetical protein
MNIYQWDLEEMAVDAVVAYLKAEIGTTGLVKAALDFSVASTFPLINVAFESSDSVNDEGPFTGARRIEMTLEIGTECMNPLAADDVNDAMFKTAREVHRAVKNQVIGAIAYQDLSTRINDVTQQSIVFSSAHMTRQSVSIENNIIFTMQSLDCICAPKEI